MWFLPVGADAIIPSEQQTDVARFQPTVLQRVTEILR